MLTCEYDVPIGGFYDLFVSDTIAGYDCAEGLFITVLNQQCQYGDLRSATDSSFESSLMIRGASAGYQRFLVQTDWHRGVCDFICPSKERVMPKWPGRHGMATGRPELTDGVNAGPNRPTTPYVTIQHYCGSFRFRSPVIDQRR
jgi:hypothetical protein